MSKKKYYKVPVITLRIVREPGFEFTPENRMWTPKDIADLVAPFIGDKDREHVVAIHLNQRSDVQGIELLAVGGLSAAALNARDVFKGAVVANAAAIILAHNHPSGDPLPSPDDIGFTAKNKQAGELLGIEVLDHIIVAPGGKFVSLRERGLGAVWV